MNNDNLQELEKTLYIPAYLRGVKVKLPPSHK